MDIDFLENFSNDMLFKIVEISTKEILMYNLLTNYNRVNILNFIKKNISTIFKNADVKVYLKNNLKDYNEIDLFINKNIISNTSRNISKDTICNIITKNRFYELLDYQFFIKERVLNFCETMENSNIFLNRMIIHMPTGTGKTKTSMHILTDYYNKKLCKGNIIWLAHSTELLNQAANTFNNVWSVLGCKSVNYYISDCTNYHSNNSIYFLNYAKLISIYKKNRELIDKLQRDSCLIICDEAHKSLATETNKAVEYLMTKRRDYNSKLLLGLTATPGRKFNDYLSSGENTELALLYDKNITSIKPSMLNSLQYSKNFYDKTNELISYDKEVIKYFQERKILSTITRKALIYDTEITKSVEELYFNDKNIKTDFSSNVTSKIGLIKERNIVIVNELLRLDKENKPTIVFACSNEHGKLLSNILLLSGVDNRCVFGDTSEHERFQFIEEFQESKYNILINYEVLTTGFDSPNIECVFITRPTNSIVLYSQMLGRGLRGPKMGGNEDCLLIDVQDNLKKFNDENFAFSYFNEYWG